MAGGAVRFQAVEKQRDPFHPAFEQHARCLVHPSRGVPGARPLFEGDINLAVSGGLGFGRQTAVVIQPSGMMENVSHVERLSESLRNLLRFPYPPERLLGRSEVQSASARLQRNVILASWPVSADRPAPGPGRRSWSGPARTRRARR